MSQHNSYWAKYSLSFSLCAPPHMEKNQDSSLSLWLYSSHTEGSPLLSLLPELRVQQDELPKILLFIILPCIWKTFLREKCTVHTGSFSCALHFVHHLTWKKILLLSYIYLCHFKDFMEESAPPSRAHWAQSTLWCLLWSMWQSQSMTCLQIWRSWGNFPVSWRWKSQSESPCWEHLG